VVWDAPPLSGGYLPFAALQPCATLIVMLADEVTTIGAYATAFLGGFLLLWLAIHSYARWTIRNLDQNEEA
jgi:hypothetical protein